MGLLFFSECVAQRETVPSRNEDAQHIVTVSPHHPLLFGNMNFYFQSHNDYSVQLVLIYLVELFITAFSFGRFILCSFHGALNMRGKYAAMLRSCPLKMTL